MKSYWGVEVYLHTFLILAPDGGELLGSCSGCFTPRGKSPPYPLNSMLDGPQSRSGHGGEEEKIPASAGNRTPVVQLVA